MQQQELNPFASNGLGGQASSLAGGGMEGVAHLPPRAGLPPGVVNGKVRQSPPQSRLQQHHRRGSSPNPFQQWDGGDFNHVNNKEFMQRQQYDHHLYEHPQHQQQFPQQQQLPPQQQQQQQQQQQFPQPQQLLQRHRSLPRNMDQHQYREEDSEQRPRGSRVPPRRPTRGKSQGAEFAAHPHLPQERADRVLTRSRRSKSVGAGLGLKFSSTASVASSAVSITSEASTSAASESNLLLYYVSKPEPRARWVFNLSKHTNIVDNSNPPDKIASIVDAKRPNLGGLVWINAVLGNLHCCLQKGTKNKAVTPVPVSVLDGWLNGQAGHWWIGALKERHRVLWDSHVVMNWAMVFIPSYPEVAARNNMEVWHDKCLPGSLRMARSGQLARKISDIVTDNQDMEPDQVVHTHLCILLAENEDLDLKRPRMFSRNTPRGSGSVKALKHSASSGTMDLSEITMDKYGTARVRAASSTGDMSAYSPDSMALEEALEKVETYRGRVLILKEDRRTKKEQLRRLRNEMQAKEETFACEFERLRQERDDINERARVLWDDLAKLRQEAESSTAESNVSKQDAELLKRKVDRLRRERNSARTYAMRWLEQQGLSSAALMSNGGGGPHTPDDIRISEQIGLGFNSSVDGSIRVPAPFLSNPVAGNGVMVTTDPNADSDGVGEGPGFQDANSKAAATIAKLKSKVTRLRRERDDAETHAANWLKMEQEKMVAVSRDGSPWRGGANTAPPGQLLLGNGGGGSNGTTSGSAPTTPIHTGGQMGGTLVGTPLREELEVSGRVRGQGQGYVHGHGHGHAGGGGGGGGGANGLTGAGNETTARAPMTTVASAVSSFSSSPDVVAAKTKANTKLNGSTATRTSVRPSRAPSPGRAASGGTGVHGLFCAGPGHTNGNAGGVGSGTNLRGDMVGAMTMNKAGQNSSEAESNFTLVVQEDTVVTVPKKTGGAVMPDPKVMSVPMERTALIPRGVTRRQG